MIPLANIPSVHRRSMEGALGSLGSGLRLRSISVGIAESKVPQNLSCFLQLSFIALIGPFRVGLTVVAPFLRCFILLGFHAVHYP